MGEAGTERGRWRFGGVDFDAVTGDLTVEGQRVELDRPCAALLAALLARAGQPIGRDDLLAAGWAGRIVNENSLTKAIGRLRLALGPEGQRIESVYGSGYRLTGAVEPLRRRGPVRWRRRLLGDRWRIATTAGMAALAASVVITVAAVLAAHAARARADEEVRESEALVAFLSSDLLAPADGATLAERDISLHRAVERAAATMNTRLRDDPATRVTVHRMIANAYAGWGDQEKAVLHLDRARTLAAQLHGDDDAKTLPIDIALCNALRRAGDTRLAEPTCAHAERTAQHGNMRQRATARLARAKLLYDIGDYGRSATLLDAVAADDAVLTAGERVDVQWFSALVDAKLAHFGAADASFRRTLAMREALNGTRHPLTARAHDDYGLYLVSIGEYAAGERQFNAAQAVFAGGSGAAPADVQAYGMALADLSRGEPAPARDRLRRLLPRYRAALGADHLHTLEVASDLALAEAQAGDTQRATTLLRDARATGARVLYGRDGRAVRFHMRWARTLAALGNPGEADRERKRAEVAMNRSGLAGGHPWRARLHCLAARIALARGDETASRRDGVACLAALRAVGDLPRTYPALAEARALARDAPAP